jgi:uncharacterized protein DUF4186
MRGMPTVREHAEDLVGERLEPAQAEGPQADAVRGHPVFVAQHATVTCCRGCLERWHGIPSGRELDQSQRDDIVEANCRWIEADVAGSGR